MFKTDGTPINKSSQKANDKIVDPSNHSTNKNALKASEVKIGFVF